MSYCRVNQMVKHRELYGKLYGGVLKWGPQIVQVTRPWLSTETYGDLGMHCFKKPPYGLYMDCLRSTYCIPTISQWLFFYIPYFSIQIIYIYMANYMVNWFFLDDLAAVRGVSPAQRGAAWRCRRLGMQRVFTMVDGVADVCLCII